MSASLSWLVFLPVPGTRPPTRADLPVAGFSSLQDAAAYASANFRDWMICEQSHVGIQPVAKYLPSWPFEFGGARVARLGEQGRA